MAAVPVATKGKSYKAMANWREVPVLSPYRWEEKEGGKCNSAAGTGEFLSCVHESVEAPNWNGNGKLTHFLRLEFFATIVLPRVVVTMILAFLKITRNRG